MITKDKIYGFKSQVSELKKICNRRSYATNPFYMRVIDEMFYKNIQPKYHLQNIHNLKQKHVDYYVMVLMDKYKNIKTLKNRLAAMRNILEKMDKHSLIKSNKDYGIEQVRVKYQDKRLNKDSYHKDYINIKKVYMKEVRHGLFLQRLFGLRMREAALMRFEESVIRNDKGKIIRLDILRGSKSGRPRYVPVVSNSQRNFLEIMLKEYKGNNVIPKDINFKQWSDRFYYNCKKYGITNSETKPHGLRQSYAQERFDRLMKSAIEKKIEQGQKIKIDKIKKIVGFVISRELGHNRLRVLVHYIENWSDNNLLKLKYTENLELK